MSHRGQLCVTRSSTCNSSIKTDTGATIIRLMRRKFNGNQKALKVDIEALSDEVTRDRFKQTLEEKPAAENLQHKVTQLNIAIHAAAAEVLPPAFKKP